MREQMELLQAVALAESILEVVVEPADMTHTLEAQVDLELLYLAI
jgi:hypothetical protein